MGLRPVPAVRKILHKEKLSINDFGVIENVGEILAVGHRVEHGGEKITNSVMIDNGVKKIIKECFELAPLHNPPNMKLLSKLCKYSRPEIVRRKICYPRNNSRVREFSSLRPPHG